jgi:hypothetical protein
MEVARKYFFLFQGHSYEGVDLGIKFFKVVTALFRSGTAHRNK